MFRRGFKSSCESTAIQVRRNLKLEADAPLQADSLAASLRVLIWTLDDLSELPADVAQRLRTAHADAWSAMTLAASSSHVIIVNPAHSSERRGSDVMHELAHLLLEHEPGNVFFGASGLALRTHNKDQEDEARWLSACLMLSRECLFLIRRKRWSDDEACVHFCVSREMLAFRRQTSGVDKQFFSRARNVVRRT